MDWREMEKSLVEYFRREGPLPRQGIGINDPMAGEWFIKYGNGKINLSDLARDLARRW